MKLRLVAPSWGQFALALVCALSVPVAAQPKKPAPAPTAAPTPAPKGGEKSDTAAAKKAPKEQNFNFEGLGLNGRSRSPQLLYFLERANEELERASLEKRSFIPHLVRTVEDEAL